MSIAAINGPENTVVSGRLPALHEAAAEIEAQVEEYKRETDILGLFIKEQYGEEQLDESFKDSYEAYKGWHKESGERLPFSRRVFGEQLRSRGFEVYSAAGNIKRVRSSLNGKVTKGTEVT